MYGTKRDINHLECVKRIQKTIAKKFVLVPIQEHFDVNLM